MSAREADPADGREENDALVRTAAVASVGVAASLIAAKAVAYVLTDSVGLLSTLVDSLLDIAASTMNLLAVRHARTPADVDHRFGHGKAEPLAGLAQAAFISGSAVFLVVQAIQRLWSPRELSHGMVGIGVMVGSIIATLALVRFQRHVARKSGSVAIEADALHYTTDLLANAAVIVAVLLATQLGWLRADPIISLLIAGYILYSALQIGRRALDMLMDRELAVDERERIVEAVRAVEGVIDLHDLRTRLSGPQVFVQLHIELDPDLPLRAVHRISSKVERAVRAAIPGADVIIHEDPHGVDEPRSGLPLLPEDAGGIALDAD